MDSINIWIHKRGTHYHVRKTCDLVDLQGKSPYEERKVKINYFISIVINDGLSGVLEICIDKNTIRTIRRYRACPKCMYKIMADTIENSLIENIIGLQQRDKVQAKEEAKCVTAPNRT